VQAGALQAGVQLAVVVDPEVRIVDRAGQRDPTESID
jgi:hypothetical protein